MSPEEQRQLAEAGARARKIRAAAGLAGFNGWSLAICSASTLALSWTSALGLALAAALGGLAWIELRGRKGILALDARAARVLGKNQLALLALIIAYCIWNMLRASDPSATGSAELDELIAADGIGPLVSDLTVLVYGLVIAASVLFQGYCARYYFARERMIRAYLAQTPEWIVELQRSLGAS